ncbi:MAG: hypothetical protein HY205_06040 [Nitrospirae bacterium]|nr:hypothetical protein [Nitrospirota bacterium]
MMTRCTDRAGGVGDRVIAGLVLLSVCAVPIFFEASARELLAPKEQAVTEIDPTTTPSLDKQKANRPQSLFTWIEMAKGYEVEWDSFGRSGWYTQDPRIKPIEPGTSVFTPDTAAVYIVFEVPPLEDPATFSARWYREDEQGKIADTPVGQDSLFVPWHEKQGFLELRKPPAGWATGKYVVKIYISPEGQQAFHAVNQVGTMSFKIVERPAPADAAVSK